MTTPDPTTPDEAILIALDRVNVSLRVVLAAIAELKAEMNQHAFPAEITPDVMAWAEAAYDADRE